MRTSAILAYAPTPPPRSLAFYVPDGIAPGAGVSRTAGEMTANTPFLLPYSRLMKLLSFLSNERISVPSTE